MSMKFRAIITSISALILFTGIYVSAGEGPVTPYGGYCRDCTRYGACRATIPPKEALHSLRKYYEERGYRIGTSQHHGRFIEAEIYRDSKQVDKVIFDRKTGRIRSMY